jgi:hypothetical protein
VKSVTINGVRKKEVDKRDDEYLEPLTTIFGYNYDPYFDSNTVILSIISQLQITSFYHMP